MSNKGIWWKPIPGYDGIYEASRAGEVRSWRKKGNPSPTTPPHPRLLVPFRRRKDGRLRPVRFVKLTDENGVGRDVTVLSIMVRTWLGGTPPGMVAYHKNGDLSDNSLTNIGFISPEQLGKRTGGSSRRRAVIKYAKDGTELEVYPSARAAAKANYISYQTVLDRCNGKVKNPFALGGVSYKFDNAEE